MVIEYTVEIEDHRTGSLIISGKQGDVLVCQLLTCIQLGMIHVEVHPKFKRQGFGAYLLKHLQHTVQRRSSMNQLQFNVSSQFSAGIEMMRQSGYAIDRTSGDVVVCTKPIFSVAGGCPLRAGERVALLFTDRSHFEHMCATTASGGGVRYVSQHLILACANTSSIVLGFLPLGRLETELPPSWRCDRTAIVLPSVMCNDMLSANETPGSIVNESYRRFGVEVTTATGLNMVLGILK